MIYNLLKCCSFRRHSSNLLFLEISFETKDLVEFRVENQKLEVSSMTRWKKKRFRHFISAMTMTSGTPLEEFIQKRRAIKNKLFYGSAKNACNNCKITSRQEPHPLLQFVVQSESTLFSISSLQPICNVSLVHFPASNSWHSVDIPSAVHCYSNGSHKVKFQFPTFRGYAF